MSESIQKRNFDGNSEVCRDCKSFYRTGDMDAPCDTCNYRKEEEKRLSAMKPNCGNCPLHCGLSTTGTPDGRGFLSEYSSVLGCLSHPGAREYLMQDVIGGLECLKQQSTDEGFVVASFHYDKVIALIRDGVKK